MSWARVRHRVAQFFITLLAPVLPVDETVATRYLAPPLLALFRRMSRAERRHGITICRALERQGLRDPDLLAAALLHDVGKLTAPPWIWERVAVVLVERFLPARAAHWSAGEPRGWRRSFVVRRRHPAWGGEMAARAGASPRTAALIARHNDPPGDDAELAALQAVDEA